MMNRLESLNVLAILISFVGAQPAMAGGDVSGGGDSFVCNRPLHEGLKNLNFSAYVYLADTAPVLKDSSDWDRYIRMNRSDLLAIALTAIEEQDRDLSVRIRKVLPSLSWTFVSSLEELEDDDIAEIPAHCRKQQLAIQDIATGRIRVNSRLFHRLSHLEQALLQIHEAYIHLQTPEEIRRRNTRGIRKRVSDLLVSEDFRQTLDRSAWCWSNPAHAYTGIFFEQQLSKRQKSGNWFEKLDRLLIGRIFSVAHDFAIETMIQQSLADQIEMFMLAQGAIREGDASLDGEIVSAFQARNYVTVSEMAHIVDSTFRFQGEVEGKERCLHEK